LTHAPTLAAFVGPDLVVQFATDAARVWLGAKPTDLVGQPLSLILGDDGVRRFRAYIDLALSGGTAITENDIAFRGKPPRRVRATYAGRIGSDNAPLGFFLVMEDRTNSLQAEEMLKAVLGMIGDSFMSFDEQLRITEFNFAAERTFGLRRDSVIGRDVRVVFPTFSNSAGGRLTLQVLADRQARREEVRSTAKPGTTFLLDVLPLASGGVAQIHHDITEMKKAEAASAQATARLLAAMEAAQIAVWCEGDDGIDASPQLNRILGFPEGAQPTAEQYRLGYLPGEYERVRAAAVHALNSGEERFSVQYQYRRHDDGRVVWLEMRGKPLAGRTAMTGVIIDVTGRKVDDGAPHLVELTPPAGRYEDRPWLRS
jgi:PAS domain S-box-containing protein